jgi:exodeoxyribonuclease-3
VKIATWNVNSLNVRLPHVTDWIGRVSPDVLAIQETKMEDFKFPVEAFDGMGYHAIFSGQKTYNGVAVVSRSEPMDPVVEIPGFDDPQRRVLAVTLGDVRVVNLYVPNGSEVGSDKYRYKLAWLEALLVWLHREISQHPRMIVLGDFNIAPEDRDVHAPDQWQDKILCSPPERDAFSRLLGLGLHDAFRQFDQDPQSFSWWDYRMNGFARNLGLRIDHVLVSEALRPLLDACHIDREPRMLERPSDHAPVLATLR